MQLVFFFVAVQKEMGTKIEVSLLVLFYSHTIHIPPPNLTFFYFSIEKKKLNKSQLQYEEKKLNRHEAEILSYKH